MADPIQQNIAQTSIPDYARPYVENLLGQSAALTDLEYNPCMQYMGERQAQFSPLQQQSYENAALMQTAPQLKDATALAGQAGLGALNTGFTYNPYIANTATSGFSSTPYSSKDATSSYIFDPYKAESFTDSGTAANYMSPYMQNVVDVQSQQARRQADIAGQTQQAQAARSGAFGGARDYLSRAQGNADLQRTLAGIQATGSQNAFQQGMQQFNADQAAKLAAANLKSQQGQFGAQQSLQAQLANQQASQAAAGLNAQQGQFGAQQSMQAQLANQQANQAAANLNAQQGQFGAGFGLQGLQTALTSANTLGSLGGQQYTQNMGAATLQNQFGQQQQQQAQSILNNQYNDFQNFQNYPYKQLGFMSDMLRGLPLTQQSSSIYQQAPGMAQQVVGLGTAALGASKLFAEGGMADSRPAGLADLALYRMAQG
jgi:hypothetical protein